jgi:adenylate cyclase
MGVSIESLLHLHRGQVLRRGGPCVCAAFEHTTDAVLACLRAQELPQAFERDQGREAGAGFGIDTGDFISIDGDIYGAAAQTAAALAVMAVPNQIIMTPSVIETLDPGIASAATPLSPLYLPGKDSLTQLFELASPYQSEPADSAECSIRTGAHWLEITLSDGLTSPVYEGDRLTFGRSQSAGLQLCGSLVSRLHGCIEGIQGEFVLTDASTSGTWVYFDGASTPTVVRQRKCALSGTGQIVFGGDLFDDQTAKARFTLRKTQ